jgi:hypothetical protein
MFRRRRRRRWRHTWISRYRASLPTTPSSPWADIQRSPSECRPGYAPSWATGASAHNPGEPDRRRPLPIADRGRRLHRRPCRRSNSNLHATRQSYARRPDSTARGRCCAAGSRTAPVADLVRRTGANRQAPVRPPTFVTDRKTGTHTGAATIRPQTESGRHLRKQGQLMPFRHGAETELVDPVSR